MVIRVLFCFWRNVCAFFSVCLEVLREGSMASLNFVQNKRFQDWRKIFVQERLEGKPVTEELVGLGLAVERGPDWYYDTTEDDKTPEDGGSEGFGLVVGWRTKSGRSADINLNRKCNIVFAATPLAVLFQKHSLLRPSTRAKRFGPRPWWMGAGAVVRHRFPEILPFSPSS